MQIIKHFSRCLKQASPFIIRAASNAPSKFQKNYKILQYFEYEHKYAVKPDLSELKDTITNYLESRNDNQTSKLDIMLCQRLKDMDFDSILYVLNAWASVRPDLLPLAVVYQSFLNIIRKGSWKTAEWNHLVQIIHFVGYLNGEQDSKSLMTSFLHTVNNSMHLHRAHYKDICIICESAFRTSTPIFSPAILNKVDDILDNHCVEMTYDSVWLVMVIKMMMLSKHLDTELLEKLSQTWLKSGQVRKMSLTTQCYILSLFARASLPNDKLFQLFINSIGRQFEDSHPTYRIKDVATFLWAVSSLNYKLSTRFLDEHLQRYFLSQLTPRNQTEGMHWLIQSCISMWMMDFTPVSLIDKVVTIKAMDILRNKKNPRELSRFAALLDIVQTERRTLTLEQTQVKNALSSCSLLVPSIPIQLKKRPLLTDLHFDLNKAGFQNVHFHFPVKFYMLGVSARHGKFSIHADVLDETTTLVHSYQPTGILKAKVKLLKMSNPNLKHAYVTESTLTRSPTLEEWCEIFKIPNKRNIN